MKKYMNFENITITILMLLLVALVVAAIVVIYNYVNGCPECGCHTWVETGNVYRVFATNNFPHTMKEMACENCGHIL